MFVLQTNARLSPLEAMLVYKNLSTVERTFRTAKSLFETRPIYHQLDATIRGHVACSFLALVLKKELEDRLAATSHGARASWPAVIADLDSLTETEVEQDGKRFLLRSAPRPAASLALSALGLALPPTLRLIGDALPTSELRNLVPRTSSRGASAFRINNLASCTVEDQPMELRGFGIGGWSTSRPAMAATSLLRAENRAIIKSRYLRSQAVTCRLRIL